MLADPAIGDRIVRKADGGRRPKAIREIPDRRPDSHSGRYRRWGQVRNKMKSELKQDEQVIKQGAANLQRGIETVGRWLYLTNQRLVFEAHDMNIQRGSTEIELPDIQSSEKCWTKFLGFIPLMPNSLAVYTKASKEYRFVLFGRGAWAAAIDAQKRGSGDEVPRFGGHNTELLTSEAGRIATDGLYCVSQPDADE